MPSLSFPSKLEFGKLKQDNPEDQKETVPGK